MGDALGYGQLLHRSPQQIKKGPNQLICTANFSSLLPTITKQPPVPSLQTARRFYRRLTVAVDATIERRPNANLYNLCIVSSSYLYLSRLY